MVPLPKSTSLCLPVKSLVRSRLTVITAVVSIGHAFCRAVVKVRLAGKLLSAPLMTAITSPVAAASRMTTLLSQPRSV